MLTAAMVLPACPGEPSDESFPLRDRLRLRDNFGFVLQQLRCRAGPFQALGKGPWAVFIGIACHLQLNPEAWPSQDTIARFSGFSVRAVRDYVAELERGGFLSVRRERRPDGGERILYAPGPVTLCELAAFNEEFPKDRPKVLRPPYTDATTRTVVRIPNDPPAPAASPLAEAAAAEPPDRDQIKPSSCRTTAGPPSAASAEEQQAFAVAPEDQEIARQGLAERMKRKHPLRPTPGWFDAAEISLVAACATAMGGDAEAKLLAQRDAITGAFFASRNGPPTVRFIWGNLDHFLDHVERGRRERLADERNARIRCCEARTPHSSAQHPRVGFAEIPRAQMTADLEKLFGHAWRTRIHR
jgi:hypothetical protein